MSMADEIQQINPAAFTSLAGKLEQLMGQLSEDENALLRVIMGLAEETLTAAKEGEVAGYAYTVGQRTTPPLNQLRSGFQSAFGPFVPGFAGGGAGRLYPPMPL
jgi:hypothetical protein